MSEVLATAALCLLAIEMVVFWATYAGLSQWWVTPLGRIYFAKTTLLTLVLLQNAASVLSQSDYPGRHPLRAIIYASGAIAMIALWTMLRKYQREGKAARSAAGDQRTQRQIWSDTLRHFARRS